MDLLQAFIEHIDKEDLFSKGDKLLLAVSGGLDSVVLASLCREAGFDFLLAHANFGLRGAESDRDEAFVRQWAESLGKELLVRRFDTQQYAAEHKVSIQVAARELRYAWFREITAVPDSPLTTHDSLPSPNSPLTTDHSPRFILTAHHRDDNIETLLMNFFKGTGIAGLRAILPKQGNILRPLLFAGRKELEQYAGQKNLGWVEDSSNLSDKYTRNYLRLHLVPQILELYPGVLQQLGDNIDRFREIEMLYRQSVEQARSRLLEQKGEEVHIPVLKLKKTVPLHTIVYEIIQPFGFSPQQVKEVIGLLDSGSGKYIRSSTHRILKDRKWLIISPHEPLLAAEHILIESPSEIVTYANGQLKLTRSSTSPLTTDHSLPHHSPLTTHQVALLDAASIQFPLLLRKWQKGDYFYPLGLRKKKKLARFFIDNKLSLADKEKVWVIEMDKKIVWVVGLRIDDRFKILPGTREILQIESRLA